MKVGHGLRQCVAYFEPVICNRFFVVVVVRFDFWRIKSISTNSLCSFQFTKKIIFPSRPRFCSSFDFYLSCCRLNIFADDWEKRWCMHPCNLIGNRSTAVKLDKIELINLHGCALRCDCVCCWVLLQHVTSKSHPRKTFTLHTYKSNDCNAVTPNSNRRMKNAHTTTFISVLHWYHRFLFFYLNILQKKSTICIKKWNVFNLVADNSQIVPVAFDISFKCIIFLFLFFVALMNPKFINSSNFSSESIGKSYKIRFFGLVWCFSASSRTITILLSNSCTSIIKFSSSFFNTNELICRIRVNWPISDELSWQYIAHLYWERCTDIAWKSNKRCAWIE